MAALSFNFTVDGSSIPAVQGGTCSGAISLAPGHHTIVEAATAGIINSSIKSVPSGSMISHNTSTGTATVNVTAGAETVVTYTNKRTPAELKICKQAASDSTQLIGEPFSFSVNGHAAITVDAGPFGTPNCSALAQYKAGTNITIQELPPSESAHVNNIDAPAPATNVSINLAARTVSLTLGSGVNVVTYTNQISVAAQPGFLEICKDASDQFVSGNFSFSVTDAAGNNYGPFSVRVGQCSGAIQVTSGPATITEASRFPYFLDNVFTSPSDRFISDNTSNGSAIVTIVAGDVSTETLVHFVNDTNSGLVKVCKVLTSNSADLAGSTFTFPISSSAGGPTSVSIVAAAPGQTACTLLNGPLNGGYPLGSNLSIGETGQSNILLTGVSVAPASSDNGSTSTTAKITVGSGVSIATFTNEALGTVEICKDAADKQTLGKPFYFSVNGGASIQVNAGQCSPAISVPAGTATIAEASSANFTLVSVTATGPDGSSRKVSGFNPVTVSVPFGGVANETLVTFTNKVNTGQFKICKTTTATRDGSGILLGGDTFNYTWSYTVDGTTTTGTASLTLPSDGQPGVTVCTGLFPSSSKSIPVQDSAGNPVTVTVTEAASTGIYVYSTNYAGSGSGANCNNDSSSNPCSPTTTFTVGQGINIETYDNEPLPPGDRNI